MTSEFYWMYWVLEKIESLEGKSSGRKDIYRGSYDVWFCEQDQIDAFAMQEHQLTEAEKHGFIEQFPDPRNDKWACHWKLTESGKQLLSELRQSDGKMS
jgi:hypothetical protein